MAGTVVGATISGQTMARVKHYKRLPTAGLTVAIAVMGLLFLYGESLSITAIEVMLGIISIGLGTLLPVTMVTVQNAVAPHEMGTATGTANFFRSLGGAFIVAIFGAIVLSGSGITGAASFEAMGEAAVRSGINLADVFSYVFLAAMVGFGLALAFLLALEEKPLRGSAAKAADAAIAD
jgi:MFS family permease